MAVVVWFCLNAGFRIETKKAQKCFLCALLRILSAIPQRVFLLVPLRKTNTPQRFLSVFFSASLCEKPTPLSDSSAYFSPRPSAKNQHPSAIPLRIFLRVPLRKKIIRVPFSCYNRSFVGIWIRVLPEFFQTGIDGLRSGGGNKSLPEDPGPEDEFGNRQLSRCVSRLALGC